MSIATHAQNELVNFYHAKLKDTCLDDPWARGLKRVILGETLEPSLLDYLVDLCVDKTPQSAPEYVETLERFLSCIILGKASNSANNKQFEKVSKALSSLKNSRPLFLQNLIDSLLSLITHFHEGDESFSLSQSDPMLCGELFEKEKVPNALVAAKYGCFLALLGIIKDEDSLCEKALRIADQLAQLFDQNNAPFRSIWIRQTEYDTNTLIGWYFFLFRLAQHLTPKYEEKTENLTRHLEIHGSVPYLPILLSHYFDQYILPMKQPKKLFLEKQPSSEYGLYHPKAAGFSIVSSFIGTNTSLGAIHKKEVQILAHGPHFLPLGESERFGIQRVRHLSLNDIIYEQSDETFCVSGWTKLASVEDCWLDHKMQKKEGQIQISARLCNVPDDKTLAYVYFVKASHAYVEEKEIRPKSLDHYRDETQKVTFHGKAESLSISAGFMGEMQVIPLAGDHHFWGADFLLAFLLPSSDTLYKWHLV